MYRQGSQGACRPPDQAEKGSNLQNFNNQLNCIMIIINKKLSVKVLSGLPTKIALNSTVMSGSIF